MHDPTRKGPKLTLKCQVQTCSYSSRYLTRCYSCSLKQNKRNHFECPESKFDKPYVGIMYS
ncbi:hypothetical protein Lalb_Chr07g0182011 [Lupinus albus]|uniref:Uncharacterized protein n=1 Tax=Lupinus albus TaxID=3870 RepID=A0A6A4Q821_LUPAL|nr:hypothetical protein Lalb_Chr07g0182011 [Lupinus albus]